ncbi:roquin-2 [Osmerus mordax]|uniref:roquin-2 n=1 Tax=Osmerus mordax TaxID=8014 RepID=UPI00350FD583
MPVQAAQWTEFLSCPICYHEFDNSSHQPISLGCSHTVCHTCLHKLHRKACPFDHTAITTDIDLLPVNTALLQLVGAQVPEAQAVSLNSQGEVEHYEVCRVCVEDLAVYLKPISGGKGGVTLSPSALSRPMQRKLVTLVNCQLVEEEGRVRAVRAGRSLGERTVTELILQHQNPQQLSANLWAAVRARGCQFLGPAMQEDALKLVLLALEDGSALSRKVLVLFVVQKLEPRFPQASKTSIGHVVQLLYRASCFKVTKRDEDSSLMQLKEEFRTYEALRREHDAQIVHIAMEAGLRISPEQWSSLLYGDLIHKSHMQSIIDKLQSPESFAKSIQELTIVLQRTGDPANLTSLRLHLELLANIDHNPEAAAPSWEELDSVMLAVKVVVQGLVEFIQNFSKKSHETPQPQPNSKYKTSMCRDLRQQGGCPRGTNCTFAHTQDELEKYRMRNKKILSVGRPCPLQQGLLGQGLSVEAGEVPASVGGAKGPDARGSPVEGLLSHPTPHPHPQPQLVSRGTELMEDMKRSVPNGANGLIGHSRTSSGPTDQKSVSPPRTPVSLSSSGSSPHVSGGRGECVSGLSKQGHFLFRGPPPHSQPHPPQSELYYQEARPAYDTPPYQPSSNYYPSSLHPHKPCMTRFLRSSHVSESSLPPSLTSSYSQEPQQHPSYPPPRERVGPYPPPQYGALPPSRGVYAPLYDSRRVWRPQLYHREDARSNSLPPEVLHTYQPPLRERFNSLDSPYCSGGEHRAALHREPCGRVPLGYEDLFRRKQEQWGHQHGNCNRPSQSSPIFTVDFGTEHVEGGGGQCVGCRYRGEESLAHYSPWSCGAISSCISPFEPEHHNHASTHSSCSEHSEVEGCGGGGGGGGCGGGGGGGGGGQRWLHTLEPYRTLKEEDPIIPFGEGPIISKWGAISRAARTGYHTTDPVQATASQAGARTTPINFRDYGPHLGHGDYRWSSRGSDSSSHSSFLESDQLCVSELQGRRRSSSGEEKVCEELRQREFCQDRAQSEPDRDIELELSVLDMEDRDTHNDKCEESLDLGAPPLQDPRLLAPPSMDRQPPQTDPPSPGRADPHLLKKMAFRKSLSPGGLAMGKLVLRTGPPRLGDTTRPKAGGEMLLNRS